MEQTEHIRYHLLDELRGFAVVCMVIYHAFYTVFSIFGSEVGGVLLEFFMPAEPFFAAFFIFLSGLSCVLSHSNLKRGIKLFLLALAISAVMFLLTFIGIDEMIWFGVLQLLSVCMIMAGLLQKQLKKLPPLPSIAVCFLLFLLTYKFQLHFYEVKYLFWLGFPSAAFSSSDYFPILPWLFMFFCGFFIGNYFKEKGFPKVLEKKRCPPLGFTGRHALIIYIVHQPIVFALCTFLEVIL